MSADNLDPRAILAALGVRDAAALAPVAGGADTALWRVEHGGERSALRVFRPEQAATARKEVAVMRAAGERGLAVPAVRAAGCWRDRPALLLSWLPGQTVAAALQARPWAAMPLGLAFGRAQAAIHAVAAPAPLDREPDGWIALAGPGTSDLQARLRAWPHRADALLHLDYHPLNALAAGARITGVLDWANARAGDPRADLARTLTILRLEGSRHARATGLGTGRRLTVWLVLRAFKRGWRRGYRAAAGPLAGMAPFYAWAGAMMARDLAPRRGRPGQGLTDDHFARLARWTAAWTRRAGWG